MEIDVYRELYLQKKYFSIFKKNLYGKYLLKFGFTKEKILSLSEEKIKEIIQKKGVLHLSRVYLKECKINIPPRVFLFTFLIYRFPEYVDGDNLLSFLSKKIVDVFQSPTTNVHLLKRYLLSFNYLLGEYKKKDFDITLRKLSNDLIDLVKGESLIKNLDFPEKEEYSSFNESHQLFIRGECERIYHVSIDDYIASSNELRLEMERAKNIDINEELQKGYDILSEKIKKTLKKIYWDNLSNEIKEGNYDGAISLLREIKSSLLLKFKNNESRIIEIGDKIDPEFLLSSRRKEDISSLCKYIFLLLSELEKEFLQETFIVFNIIEEIISVGDDMSKMIPSILCLVVDRLGRYNIIER